MMEVEDFLEHYGVKGMRWGVRNDKKASPEERIARINKKINKIDAEKIYGGAGLVGNYQKRNPSKHPYAKTQTRIALRGALEAATLLGGGTILMKKLGVDPSVARGAQISLGLLAASVIGGTRISEIHSVHVYKTHKELIEQRDAIEKELKRR